jgi:hypothetical protein
MTDSVSIKWVKTNYSNLKELPDTHFYLFARGNSLLYIGMSKDQDVIDEIKQTMRSFQIKTHGLSVYLGYISNSSFKKISKYIIRDTESMIIFKNKPKLNTQCVKNYTGRIPLRVISHNCRYLKKTVQIC